MAIADILGEDETFSDRTPNAYAARNDCIYTLRSIKGVTDIETGLL